MLRIRWEALRQLALVLPGTLLLAWALSRLIPGMDPLASFLRVRTRAIVLSCMILVAAGACLTSCWILRSGPFVPGDEDEYLFQARVLARGRLWWDRPQQAEFFTTPGQLLRGGRLFGHHQLGHSALLVPGVIAGLPRAVPILMAVAVIPLCYVLGRRLGGENAGKLSVVLLALSPFFLFTMGSLVSETSSMFLLVAATYLLLVAERSTTREVAAGSVLGLAVATRALSAVAVGAPVVALWIRRRGPSGVPRLLAGAVPLLAAIAAVNAVLTGSPWRLPFTLHEPDPLGFDERFGLAQGLGNLLSNLGLLNFWLSGWPLGLGLVMLGLWILRRNTLALSLAIASAGLGAAYVLYWHGGQVATGPLRFFELCPFLLCVTAGGLAVLRRRLPRAAPAVGWVVILASVMSLLTFMPGRAIVLRRFTEGVEAPLRTVKEAKLSKAVVFLQADNYLFSYPRNDLDFMRNGEVVFARDRGELNHDLMKLFPDYLSYRLVRNQDGRWQLHSLARKRPPPQTTSAPGVVE
jgi:NADH:ubiquinone oxidoreductase subunit K